MSCGDKNKKLVEKMRKKGNLTEDRVEDAFLETPRENFVPEEYKEHAYRDTPLSIGEGQTISQPSVVAKMTQWLDPQPGDKILEIGAGSGWQAAILSRLVGDEGKVYTVEHVAELVDQAKENLAKANIDNVEVVEGDGSTGLENHAPYDGIICTAASPRIQEEWIEQLKTGGRIVAPVGASFVQSMRVVEKMEGDGLKTIEDEKGYRFVKLKGEKGL
ncbi:MAG: protein-L-isoaspartate(D-aspartate) O-methyltransferase [Candidatus Aenigmatarchaeota archaeon]